MWAVGSNCFFYFFFCISQKKRRKLVGPAKNGLWGKEEEGEDSRVIIFSALFLGGAGKAISIVQMLRDGICTVHANKILGFLRQTLVDLIIKAIILA